MRRLGFWILVGVLSLVGTACGVGGESQEGLGLLVQTSPTGSLSSIDIVDCGRTLGGITKIEVESGSWKKPALLEVLEGVDTVEGLLSADVASDVVRARSQTGKRTQAKQLQPGTKYRVIAVTIDGGRRTVGSFTWAGPGQLVTDGYGDCD